MTARIDFVGEVWGSLGICETCLGKGTGQPRLNFICSIVSIVYISLRQSYNIILGYAFSVSRSIYIMADHDLTFFQSIPWCASLINDPAYVAIPTTSRVSKENTEDALFGDILKTGKTISACLSLYKKPAASTASIEEVTTLLSLEPGLNGYANICHGGIIATILDEFMGLLISVNKDREAEVARATTKPAEKIEELTAELTIKYLKPVTTPQIVRVKVWFSRGEGRKFWMQGTIEDKSGGVLARGEAIFIRIRKGVL